MTVRLITAMILVMGLAVMSVPGVSLADEKPVRQEAVRVVLNVEGWVRTSTARVDIVGELTLINQVRGSVRTRISRTLAELIPGVDWRMTSFSRRSDRSGAERWVFRATTRLPQDKIDGLQGKLRKLNVPGKNYRLGNIRMSPSLAEIEDTRAELRRRIYVLAGKEALAAKGLWPGRKVIIQGVNFAPMPTMRTNMRRDARMPNLRTMEATAGSATMSAAAPMAVDQKITVSAIVSVGPEKSGR